MQASVSVSKRNVILKWWLKNLLFIVLSGLLLFSAAGKINWVEAWIYLFLILAIIIANALCIEPELMIERAQINKGTKKWDLILSIFVAIWGPFLILLIAGLDNRFNWTQNTALVLQVAGAILFLLGGLLGTWAMAANRYFSGTVRIQKERKHIVVSEGPYRFIRHPGYTGGIVSNLMTPILLGSWIALYPAFLIALAYIMRTALEDKVLKNELDGYLKYCQQVRYRLFPGIW